VASMSRRVNGALNSPYTSGSGASMVGIEESMPKYEKPTDWANRFNAPIAPRNASFNQVSKFIRAFAHNLPCDDVRHENIEDYTALTHGSRVIGSNTGTTFTTTSVNNGSMYVSNSSGIGSMMSSDGTSYVMTTNSDGTVSFKEK